MKNTTVREDVREIKETLQSLVGLVEVVGGLSVEVKGLSKGLKDLKGDVSELKGDVSGLKKDVSKLSNDLNNLTGAVDTLALQTFDLRTEMNEVKETMMTKQDKEEILSVADKLTQKHLKLDQEQTMMSHRLQEHDKQIAQLQLAAV